MGFCGREVAYQPWPVESLMLCGATPFHGYMHLELAQLYCFSMNVLTGCFRILELMLIIGDVDAIH